MNQKKNKKKKKRILLFDEDYRTMQDLKEHLEETLGWEVELTAGEAVLELLGKVRFDLIALDLMIHPQSLDADGEIVENVQFEGTPWQQTGLEFLRRLRRGEYQGEGARFTRNDVPVIVLSSVAGTTVEKRALNDKFDLAGYVEKPFRLKTVEKQMRKLLGES